MSPGKTVEPEKRTATTTSRGNLIKPISGCRMPDWKITAWRHAVKEQ